MSETKQGKIRGFVWDYSQEVEISPETNMISFELEDSTHEWGTSNMKQILEELLKKAKNILVLFCNSDYFFTYGFTPNDKVKVINASIYSAFTHTGVPVSYTHLTLPTKRIV